MASLVIARVDVFELFVESHIVSLIRDGEVGNMAIVAEHDFSLILLLFSNV